jgi:hypothetical protein
MITKFLRVCLVIATTTVAAETASATTAYDGSWACRWLWPFDPDVWCWSLVGPFGELAMFGHLGGAAVLTPDGCALGMS